MSPVAWCASCGLINAVVRLIAFGSSVVGLLSCFLFGLRVRRVSYEQFCLACFEVLLRQAYLVHQHCVLNCFTWAGSIFIGKE